MNKFDLDEIRGMKKKDPTKTFIGGLVIGFIIFGSLGFFIGFNFHLWMIS